MTAASPHRVLVVGEALTDVVVARGSQTEVPGGGPLNVAVGLGRLGDEAHLVCALGDDARGARIRAHAAQSGVQVDKTRIPRTSSAVATISTDGSASYAFDLDWRLDPVAVPVGTSLLHVGSIAAVLPCTAAAVRAAVHGCPPETLVSVDPNVRPSITPDRKPVLTALGELFHAADIVKLSVEDATWLWPGRSTDAVLDGLLVDGAQLAAVTAGADGCVIATAAHRLALPAPVVHVADTIGAGDSFMSGLLHSVLATGVQPRELDASGLHAVAEFALSCAAVTVSRPGADPPTPKELSV